MNLQGIISALPSRHWRELGRIFRNHRYERNDDGDLLIAHAKFSGVWECTAPDGQGTVVSRNLLTTEGANHLLSVAVAGGTQYTTWYIAPFSGNVTVLDTWTAATFAAAATELTTQYSEGTRVAFTESVPSAKSTNNTSNPATITAASDSVSIWGLGLLSSSTKGATSGVLLSAVKYSTVRTLPTTGDTIGLKYTMTLSN
jgi:hypothetical protein